MGKKEAMTLLNVQSAQHLTAANLCHYPKTISNSSGGGIANVTISNRVNNVSVTSGFGPSHSFFIYKLYNLIISYFSGH